MGDSKFDSNIQGKNGTETISNFASISSTAVTGTSGTFTGAVQGAQVKATSYTKIGNKFIFEGSLATQASIVAAAQALVTNASLQGSWYMGDDNPWYFTATNLATPITVP